MRDIFKVDFDRIRADVQTCVIDIAKDTMTNVIEQSPAPGVAGRYSIGSYVLSHRVTFDGERDIGVTWLADEDPDAHRKAKARVRSITKAVVVVGQDVLINNEIPYADKVESIGWSRVKPYATYSKAFTLSNLRAMSRAAAV